MQNMVTLPIVVLTNKCKIHVPSVTVIAMGLYMLVDVINYRKWRYIDTNCPTPCYDEQHRC